MVATWSTLTPSRTGSIVSPQAFGSGRVPANLPLDDPFQSGRRLLDDLERFSLDHDAGLRLRPGIAHQQTAAGAETTLLVADGRADARVLLERRPLAHLHVHENLGTGPDLGRPGGQVEGAPPQQIHEQQTGQKPVPGRRLLPEDD